jgi:hypothetical protein
MEDVMNGKFSYYEKQQARYSLQWWLIIALVIGLAVLDSHDFYTFSELSETAKASKLKQMLFKFIPMFVILGGIVFLVHCAYFEIWIDEHSISYKAFPFKKKTTFFRSDITKLKLSKIKTVDGGWNLVIMRIGFGGNKTEYVVKGKKGFSLKLLNGKELVFGTTNPEKISELITNLKEKWRM